MSEYGIGCRPKLADLLECLGLDATYTRARGAHLFRSDGAGGEVPVLDLVGGFGAGLLGHNNAELRALITERLAAEVPFLAQSGVRREAGLLAETLNRLLPAERPYLCHLSNSGAESIEAALKHAYKVRFDVIRRELERVSRALESFLRTVERDHPGIELPEGARDPGRFRDDLDEHNIGQLERFQAGPVVLAFKGAFHGKTTSALKVTFNRTYREGFEGLSAVQPEFIDFADVERLETILHQHRIEFLLPRIEDERLVIERVSHTTVIALCLEIIQGEGGVRPLPDATLRSLAAQHGRLGLPLIVDEIQTGCGRTGALFAYAATPLAAIEPEYITLSKGLGGGLLKVAATLIRGDVYDPNFGILHTSTFAEDELGCMVARRVLEILTRDDGRVLREVAAKGEYLLAGLHRLQARFPGIVGDVRGRGLMLGLEFAPLREHSPLFRFGSRQGFLSLLVASYLLHRRGIRMLAPLTTLLKGNPGRRRASVLRIQPAVDISHAEIDDVLDALAEVCTLIERNNEGVLVAHLLGVEVSDRERRDPAAFPVAYPEVERRVSFDARVGFIMHPAHIDQVLRYYFPTLIGRVDVKRLAQWWSRLARFLEPDVVHTGYIGAGGFVVEANFVCVPFLPRDLMEAWQGGTGPAPGRSASLRLEEIQDRIQDAVTVARELGDDHIPTSMVGLGAYTSIVTAGGTTINDFEVPVTTGNAYTAGLMLQGVRRAAALQAIPLERATAAVIGAAGNIGSVLAAILSGEVARLRLIGSDAPGSLERLRATRRSCLRHLAEKVVAQLRAGTPMAQVRIGGIGDRLLRDVLAPTACPRPDFGADGDAEAITAALEAALDRGGDPAANPYLTLHRSVDAVRDCDIVMIATSSPAGRLVSPALVRRGAVVACASVPSNLSLAFRDHMRDYLVFDGGYARLPDGQAIDCIGMPARGLAFGCLSETLLLGFDGTSHSFARGPITTAQVEHTLELAERYGFELGELKLNEAVHPAPRNARAVA